MTGYVAVRYVAVVAAGSLTFAALALQMGTLTRAQLPTLVFEFLLLFATLSRCVRGWRQAPHLRLAVEGVGAIVLAMVGVPGLPPLHWSVAAVAAEWAALVVFAARDVLGASPDRGSKSVDPLRGAE